MNKLSLTNSVVITPNLIEKTNLILIDNQIFAFQDEKQSDLSNQIFEIKNSKILPGFIDIHNHGANGIDVNETDADGLYAISKFLASKGVTAWLPTLVPDSDENYQKSIEAIDELIKTQDRREPAAARVLGVHYEGPFVNEKQCGALRTQFFKTFKNKNEIDLMPRLKSPNAIHLTTLAPEIENGIELIEKLIERNWIVSIGHTRATTETLDAALSVGAQHLTHFFNAMTGLHHRDVGVVGWGLANKKVTFDIIADKIHVHPRMLKFASQTKSPEKVVLISDSVAPAGLGDGEYTIWNEKISVVNGRTQNERGSIAGSVITMLDAAKNMLELGFNEAEVSLMASFNPAKLLKIEKKYGSIELGKQADLVAIDDHGNVRLTIVGGRIAYQML